MADTSKHASPLVTQQLGRAIKASDLLRLGELRRSLISIEATEVYRLTNFVNAVLNRLARFAVTKCHQLASMRFQ